jgi:glucan 1,3-beta-glucosidase
MDAPKHSSRPADGAIGRAVAQAPSATMSRKTRLSAALAALVAFAGCFAAWWAEGRAVAVVDAPPGLLPCVSYAPHRGAQTPFDDSLRIPAAQIEEDLRLLAKHVRCVRTYAVDQGIEQVPRLARALGLKVMLGAWIGRDPIDNARQIGTALSLARRYPDVVTALIVGNEVLLRGELTADRLRALLRIARANSPVPVTYADVWEFWLQNPDVAGDVDFITVHMLPYWENRPVPIGEAVRHVRQIYESVRAAFPGKPIFIGEAGWPSAGRMREGALPSLVNEARFVRGMLALAARDHIGLNLVEAFDQPWKRALEGTVGGHWGLFAGDRTAKFPMSGPVSADPDWLLRFAAAAGLGTLAFIAAFPRRPRLRFFGWLALASAGQAAGSALVVGFGDVARGSFTLAGWIAGLGVLGAGAVIGALALAAVTAHDGETSPRLRPAGVREALLALRGGGGSGRGPSDLVAGLLRFPILFGAALTTLCLSFDGRYRDFPIAAYAVPAAALLILAWRGRNGGAEREVAEEMLLARVLAAGGLVVAALEGPQNYQALGWLAVCLALSAPFGVRLFGFPGRRPAPDEAD